MKKFIHNSLPFAVLILLFFFCGVEVFAVGPPCDPSPGCSVNCCTPVPLDGGLSALIFAGIAFAAKKLYGHSKK